MWDIQYLARYTQSLQESETKLETKRGFMSTACNPDIKRMNGVLRMKRVWKKHALDSWKRRLHRCCEFHEFLLESQKVKKEHLLGVKQFVKKKLRGYYIKIMYSHTILNIIQKPMNSSYLNPYNFFLLNYVKNLYRKWVSVCLWWT